MKMMMLCEEIEGGQRLVAHVWDVPFPTQPEELAAVRAQVDVLEPEPADYPAALRALAAELENKLERLGYHL
ncbi:hypothetical protein EV699_1086 [Plasticicumulans lactativorans]|uniref:Uncharacterized protein n=1 Tax=Plasticicumulans lactativorans TaxID=1133106 RepID=A0A4R2LAU7_9GAMM|nr:hypothetical protein [Plasticicumulans lactativorans]TCO81376.1 hypothetical protein EV699_1086 [Plasticicumulans lactativorans]